MKNTENKSDFVDQDADSKKKVYISNQLFGNQKEILINHQGEEYKIIITRNGKLVMNK